jgi:hypothetical protein
MKYYDQYLASFPATTLAGTDKNDRNLAPDRGHTSWKAPTKTTETISVRSVSDDVEECSTLKPRWPPRPEELADWPIPWREKWGRLANDLEDQGLKFPECEREAFRLVKAEMSTGQSSLPDHE